MSRAQNAIDHGDDLSALIHLGRALKIKPAATSVYMQRAMLYANRNAWDKVIKDLTLVIHIDPRGNPDAFFKRSFGHFNIGHFRLAIKDITTFICMYPESGEGYLLRGHIYASWDYFELALADFNMAIRTMYNISCGFYQRGQLFLKQGLWVEALSEFSMVVDLDEHSSAGYRGRAQTYLEMGEPNQALIDIAQAIERDPQEPALYSLRGQIYFAIGDHPNAIEDHTRAIDMGYNATQELCRRALAFARKGDVSAAAADLAHAKKIESNKLEIWETEQVLKEFKGN